MVNRVLSVKLDLRENEASYQRLRDLGWQAARYRNLFLRALWAEAAGLRVRPDGDDKHGVSKWIRKSEKMELSGAAYSAAERETTAAWQLHGKRVLAGAPLPEWKPTAALTIRGHRCRNESGVRLSRDDKGRFVAELQAQSAKCEGGSWLTIPLALGTAKDWQAEILAAMAEGIVPILKGSIVLRPMRHDALLRLSYSLERTLPEFGERKATLGPIGRDGRLFLRTETETRDYSGKLHVLLDRKDSWDGIRRRALRQIGRRKGSARAKRKLLARLSWADWLDTYLHQWTREIVDWLKSQGIGTLSVIGLQSADWPAFKFTERLKYKGGEMGISVTTEAEANLAQPSTDRSVKQEIQRERRKTTKRAQAIRTLTHDLGEQRERNAG
jgi:hypothetical protein